MRNKVWQTKNPSFFRAVKLARDYATSVSSDQSGRWNEHGAEVIHGFFPCSQQALPPQVPPRPPERSFHNYSNLSNLKPNYGPPTSSLVHGRYTFYNFYFILAQVPILCYIALDFTVLTRILWVKRNLTKLWQSQNSGLLQQIWKYSYSTNCHEIMNS